MKAVFFDLDGTLYDKKGLALRMVGAALLRGKLSAEGKWSPLRCLQLLALERSSRRALSRLSLETVGYDSLFSLIASRCPLDADAVRTWYNEWYMEEMVAQLYKHYQVRSEMVKRISELRHEGVAVAVLSDYGHIKEKLEAIGALPSWFDALLDAPSLGGFKPSADVFRSACSFLGVDPADCEMVGDRADTDGGCRAIGMTFTQVQK